MPAWMTPELWPVWWAPIAASFSSTRTLAAGRRRLQLAGDGEADDAAADDRDVAAFAHGGSLDRLGYDAAMPDLEVVIVSSTGALELLRACLRTLRENPYTGGEMLVHVVDNASADGTPEMVREEFPEVRLHAARLELGLLLRQQRRPARGRGCPTSCCSTRTPRSTRARSTT